MSDPQLARNERPRGKVLFWTTAWILTWVGLFIVMHIPKLGDPPVHIRGGDKVVHFCAYFMVALLGTRAALARQVPLTGKWLVKWICIYAVYAVGDELLQDVVGRTAQFTDWIADVAGASAALGMSYLNRSLSEDIERLENHGSGGSSANRSDESEPPR